MSSRNATDPSRAITPAAATRSGEVQRLCALLALLACGGCVNQTFKGASSYETKRNIFESFTFVCTRTFLPGGAPRPLNTLPESLNPEETEPLRARLQELLDDIAARHSADYGQLCALLQRDLLSDIRPRLILSTTGRTVAHIESNRDLTLDLHVVQAVYRAMVMTELPRAGWPNYVVVGAGGVSPREYDFSGFEPLDYAAEARQVAAFLEFTAGVEHELGSCIIGDAFVFFDPWQLAWNDHAERTSLVEQRLLGGLLFLLAHEYGHVVLGHFAAESPIRDEAAFQADELQADRYAATLLGSSVGANWVFGRQHRVTVTMGGYELFFRAAYSLAGFDGPARPGGLAHPNWKVRLEAAETAYYAALAAASKEDVE